MKTDPVRDRYLEESIYDSLRGRFETLNLEQCHRCDRKGIGIVPDSEDRFFQIAGCQVQGICHGAVAIVGESVGDVRRHGDEVLEPSVHLPVDQEVVGLKGPILQLPRYQHIGCSLQHRLIDVPDLSGSGKSGKDESGQPKGAFVPSEGRKTTIRGLKSELSLIAHVDEVLSFGPDLGRQLVNFPQVFEYLDIGGQEDHILLATAVRHLEQVGDAVHRLGHRAGTEVEEGGV